MNKELKNSTKIENRERNAAKELILYESRTNCKTHNLSVRSFQKL